MKQIITCLYESPCGVLMLGDFEDRLCMCDWLDGANHAAVVRRLCRLLNAETMPGISPVLDQACSQLDEYFGATRKTFDISLQTEGTDFQRRVWDELLAIPFGTTVSYARLAQRIGRPKAVRAVANAVALNGISIIIPCHRIVGSDGSLTGFAGGLDAKKYLLHAVENADIHID